MQGKGKLTKETYEKIYRELNETHHLPYDCGSLCQKACCQKTNDDLGIYLLPNEELVLPKEEDWLIWDQHQAENYDFPISWRGKTFFVSCNGNCPREKRPIQCRTFPLTPHLSLQGDLSLIWETLELPYSCPLLENKEPLDEQFIQTLYRSWETLIADPLIWDLVEYDSRLREEEGYVIQTVYQKA